MGCKKRDENQRSKSILERKLTETERKKREREGVVCVKGTYASNYEMGMF